MPGTTDDLIFGPGFNALEGKAVEIPTHEDINEKNIPAINAAINQNNATHVGGLKSDAAVSVNDVASRDNDSNSDDEIIIITGADASNHLLPVRDDGDPSLTFRGLFLATILSGFQATMFQIYQFKPTAITIQGTFIVLIAYFLGKGWTAVFPRGDKLEAKWRTRGGQGKPPLWIRLVTLLNPCPWGLKEHALCSITATAASNASVAITVFTAQKLFYGIPLDATTVILSLLSIGLFGYGLCGLLRPITVWHIDAVYWSNIPTVKTLQGLHWQQVKDSKPLRYFWISYVGMFSYEFLPAYIWPWLNSVSIPCLAAMHATGSKAAVLTNLFGGSINNEGLGLFSFSFDWQYITSFQTSLPLTLQANAVSGFIVCYAIMLAIYYGDVWNARSLPFMSTNLRAESGGRYPVSKVFINGILSEDALKQYGLPRITGTFAYALFMANAAIGALITHCILFWGGDVVRAYKSARQNKFDDRHHAHMAKHYKEAPWWWYALLLLASFVLGLVVVLKEHITLSAWAYVVSLLIGTAIAPFSTLLYSRYGNGIATNNLSKMIAGLLVPGRPVGNMYFAAWSHNVILTTVNLSMDLKMGEYLKIPPRTMFLTQIWGTVLGGFINYVVMISIVTAKATLLVGDKADSSWSGATIQAFNSNAISWSLAAYLYKVGREYYMIPVGVAVGAGLVVLHRIFVKFVPRIGSLSTSDINLPQFIQYAGYIPYNQSQTCVIFSQYIAGFFVQYYLRNYRPRIFKNFSYLVTGAFDGGSLTALFILSFAVFGAGGPQVPFPSWWGNNASGYYDLCPVPE